MLSQKSGGAACPANPMYTTTELERVVEDSQSKCIITHKLCLSVATEVARSCKVRHVIVFGPRDQVPEGLIAYEDMRTTSAQIDQAPINPYTHPVFLPYSSGTTGLPKGVVLTHHNIISNLLQAWYPEGRFYGPTDSCICPLPMFHIYGLTVALLAVPLWGCPLITMTSFDLAKYCELVETHKCTRSYIVPPIVLALAKHPMVENYDLSSLKTIVSAAAPMGPELETECTNKLGVKVKQAWGLSELSPIGTLTPDDAIKPGSIGPVVSNTDFKVVSLDSADEVPVGTPGELCIRGPQVMQGYHKSPTKTQDCLSEDGWLRTGDVVTVDEDGYFYIIDRIKEMIKYKGFQVAPAELEDVLLKHPMVADVAVIPRKDEVAGEVPRAYVVLKPKCSVSAEELQSFVAANVAPYKHLRGGVIFTQTIPKTASGKLLRRVLIASDAEQM
mmetsp:Transcript_115564/g.201105  ORF Transcript_115564/g.201105 Transcript_115564/m.201105 type:complete len:444 (-) Transcript_115564:368-1699(-)